jgi:hypothetical protein
VRLGEPGVRAAARLGGESRQGLVAHDLARVERNDALEGDVEQAALHHPPDAGARRGPHLVGAAGRVHLAHQVVQRAAAHDAVEARLARGGTAQRRGELRRRRLPDDVPAAARPEHFGHRLVVPRARAR